MSTPPGAGPGDEPLAPPVPPPAAPPSWVPAYGQPSSPSYGKYGQGVALPLPPPPPPPPPGPGWGEPGYRAPRAPAARVPTHLTPVGPYRQVVTGLSVAFTAGLVLTAFLAPNQHRAMQEALDGAPAPEFVPGSDAYQLVSSVSLLVNVALWVAVALWLTKVRQNALVLDPSGQRRSEVWAWLGWVVPVVNLWFPKQMVDDVMTSTASASGRRSPGTGPWWTAWLLLMVANITGVGLNLLPPNDVRDAVAAGAVALLALAALSSWLRIVNRISVDQDALARR